MKNSQVVAVFLSAVVMPLILLSQAEAYEYWSNSVNDVGQCAGCHGKFREGNYFSEAEGVSWGEHLHDAHLGNTDVESNPNGSCDSCHGGAGSNSTRKVNLSDSADAKDGVNTISCMGCHGRLQDENNLCCVGGKGWGAGLRQHHETSTHVDAGQGTCSGCHFDANPANFTPAPESILPAWYSSVTNTSILKSMNPCSRDGEEDFSSNGTGLDNDGDQVYDALEASCTPGANRPDNDVTTFVDVTGDTVPDLAGFIMADTGKPSVTVYSGASGSAHSTIDFTNDKWQGFALGTVRDADQDGTPADPAIAMLTVNKTTLKIRVETRRVETGAFLGSIQFFNEKWVALDVLVVDDTNGDGITNDTSIAVLAERISDGRVQVQLRNFVGGALISNVVYLNARWSAVAAAVVDRSAMAPAGTLPPLIGVIAHNPLDGRRLMQSRVASTGAFDRNIKFLGSNWNYNDLSVNHDANSDGTADDPIWQVLATRASDQVIRVQSRSVVDGAFESNVAILNANWEAFRLDSSLDINSNTSQEMVISATRRADAVRRIHIKDYASGATTLNIAP